jgi:hypothetical protein
MRHLLVVAEDERANGAKTMDAPSAPPVDSGSPGSLRSPRRQRPRVGLRVAVGRLPSSVRIVLGLGLALAVAACAGDSAVSAGLPGVPSGRIVFATEGDGVSGRLEIASIRADGSGIRRLTRHDPTGHEARWTRAGTIAFSSWGVAGSANWTIRADGSGARRLAPGSLSPSGRVAARFEGSGVVVVTASGRRLAHVRLGLDPWDMYEQLLVWSHDDRYLALSILRETDSGLIERLMIVSTRPRARVVFASRWADDWTGG